MHSHGKMVDMKKDRSCKHI